VLDRAALDIPTFASLKRPADVPPAARGAAAEQAVPSGIPDNLHIVVRDDPTEYGEQVLNARIRQPNGEVVRGTPISPDDARIPDVVYHVTTNEPGIRATGRIRALGEGGLGGSARDQIVSLTTSREIAEQVADDMRLVRRIVGMGGEATVHKSPERIAASRVIRDALVAESKAEGWFKGSGFADVVQHDYLLGDYRPVEWMTQYFTSRSIRTSKRNPVFYTSDADVLRWNPENIGVVEVPKGSLRTGAMVVDFDLGKKFGLEEIRVYGDVRVRDAP